MVLTKSYTRIQNIKSIWKIIENERISGYQHRAPKKKIKQIKSDFHEVIKLDTEPISNIVMNDCGEQVQTPENEL